MIVAVTILVVTLEHPVALLEVVPRLMVVHAVLMEEHVEQELVAVEMAVSQQERFVVVEVIVNPEAVAVEMLVILLIRFVVLVRACFVLQGGFVAEMDGVLKIMEFVAKEVDPVLLGIIV